MTMQSQTGDDRKRWFDSPAPRLGNVSALVTDPLVERGPGRVWWIGFAISVALTLVMAVAVAWLFYAGVGTWGINTTVVWGYAIASYVWWIAIGSGGTLISSILVVTRQDWRRSINRFAEGMTLFAVAVAGLFPILHLGRPMYFYWLAPYPNTMALWPQWRSALIWDFWAIVSYLVFSIIFFYVGILPDLATMRDRSKSRGRQVLYGVMALGWRGSARQWRLLERLHRTLAAMGIPMVVSVHSIVGLDFAASLMPGWQETIYPPYFVVGALFSGFAMVLLVTAFFRWGMNWRSIITMNHFDAMAKIILAGSLIMTMSYATEWFNAWWGGKAAERSLVVFEFTGGYAWLYWIMLCCNCVVPLAFWSRAARRSLPVLVTICLIVLAGMWIERILIIWNTLSHGHAVPMWRLFRPTLWDWLLLVGPAGLFSMLFLLWVRIFPAVSMHGVRQLCCEDGLVASDAAAREADTRDTRAEALA